MGNECGHCIYVRQKYFPVGTKQADVLRMRGEKDPAEQGRQENLRKDRASWENRMQAEHSANTSATSKKGEERFDEAFEEGVFEELGEFAESRNLDFDDEDELVGHIEKELGFERGWGETGEYG
eukprot:7774508-Pyramimonas_sp.AAC.1